MVKVACVQFAPTFGDVAGNVRRALSLAAGAPADLYVFPELFNTGYQFRDRAELSGLAEAADGFTVSEIKSWCRRARAFVCAGFAERENERFYNAAALVGPAGLVGIYRKVHLFWFEKELFTPGGGDPFRVYDLGWTRVGMMICFDWIFPEVARILALRGAEIILHPANLVLPYCPPAMVTRCVENRVFAVTADRVGSERRREPSLRFIGMSQIVSPRGEVLARAGEEETVVACEINPAEAREKQMTPANHLFDDRRVELYGDLVVKY